MLVEIDHAFKIFTEEVECLSEFQKQLLTVSHPFCDPRFELGDALQPHVLEGVRQLFARRFLTAFQLPDGEYREISFLEWQDEVTAYLILVDGFYVHEDSFTKKRDNERYKIFVPAQYLQRQELRNMLRLILSEFEASGGEHTYFENLGDSVAGEFKPVDPGIPRWALRLCDVYDEYHRKRWSGHSTLEKFASSVVEAVCSASRSDVLKEQIAGSELLRRRSITCREFRRILSRGEVNVFVRSATATDPVVVPSVLWWVTRDLAEALRHHIIHAERVDRLSAYNGAAPFVDAQGFSRWLKGSREATASSGPGRPRGTRQYPGDEALVREIHDLQDRGEVISFAAGFQLIEHRVKGSSSPEANLKRLRRLSKKIRELG